MIKNSSNYDKKKIISYFKDKKYSKISKLSKSLLGQYGNDIDIWKIIIASEINLKNYLKAEILIKKILLKNNSPEINYLYGNVLKAQDKYDAAIVAYNYAVSLNKNFSEAYNNLANTLKKINRVDDAITNYIRAIETKNDNFEAYYNLANLFKSEKRYEEAIKNYKEAIKIKENFVDAYNNIGSIYSMLGNFEKSKKYFITAINLDPYFSDSYKNYVLSTKINENDQIFLKLSKIVENRELKEEQKKTMYFSISKAYFDLNINEKAFSYLKKANDLKFKELEYSFKKQIKNFKKIKEYFSENNFLNIKELNYYNSIPIFILGMPRSGTSLIEQIVSNHSEVHGGGELDILPSTIDNAKWESNTDLVKIIKEIRSKYMSKLNNISDKKFITDKLPGNFRWIGFIINSIPEAKVIHIERNPMAICWSNYKSNFNNTGMGYTHKQEYVAEYFILYKNLMEFWKKKFSHKIININYENFVNNYENNVRELFQNLNLKWEDHLFEFHKNNRAVETASFHQVRSKIYKNSSEQWKKYKNFLKPMIEILKKNDISF